MGDLIAIFVASGNKKTNYSLSPNWVISCYEFVNIMLICQYKG